MRGTSKSSLLFTSIGLVLLKIDTTAALLSIVTAIIMGGVGIYEIERDIRRGQ